MTETKTKSPGTGEAPNCRQTIILRSPAEPRKRNLAASASMPLRDESLAKLVQSADEIAKDKKRAAEIRRLEAEAARARFAAD